MGILSSLYTGVTGLEANGEALAIIGDNIANANTTGFKTSRAEFQDVIAKSLKGILGGNQIGRGVHLSNVTPIFTQGSVNQTERPTDLAISGDGFFAVEGREGRAYTRNGSFAFDKDGVLQTMEGSKILGFTSDEKGEITTKLEPIKLNKTVIDAKQTSEMNIFMNLDVKAGIKKDFNPEKPDDTTEYSSGLTVYDSAGNAHLVTLYFNKVGDNEWEWHAMAKGEEVRGGDPGVPTEQANGTLIFTSDGRLESQKIGKNSFNFAKGAKDNQKIKFNFGDDIKSGGKGVAGTTQYGAPSDIYRHTQDGYTAGTVAGLSFNDDGILSAIYTNGETMNLSQIAVAKFENNEALFKAGKNMFKESRNSGMPLIGRPGSGGRGRVFSKSLEQSTTDMATEFINLIQMQRAFQANSRTITTADQLLQEILNMRRS